MTTTRLTTLVIGGGIGGLTAAIALAQRGMQVTLLEQADALREVGAGLQISPNGFVVLQALGLGDAVQTAAVQARAVQLLDHKGPPVARLDLARFGAGAYHFVHRADLIDILHKAALDAGVTIKLGVTVARVEPDKAAVETSDGHHISGDLVIAADGLNSVARVALNPDSAAEFTGQVAWRALVEDDGATPEVRVFMGPRRHLVSYPLRDGKLRNLVAVQERAAWAKPSWSQQDEPGNLRKAFADFGPEVSGLLSKVTEVYLWGLFRHPVAEKWHKDRVALLGDAAHPTLPFLAQGANMALEDAWVLADSLASADSVNAGLVQYQSRRRARTQRIVKAANRNAWKYHLEMPLMRFAAHTGLRCVSRIAPSALVQQFDWLYAYDVTQTAP